MKFTKWKTNLIETTEMDKWSKQYVIIPYVFSKWASFPPQNESETEIGMRAIWKEWS